MALQLYNSLSKQVQEFSSIDPQAVKMYTCGPTVYSFAHIGNFRTFALSDFLDIYLFAKIREKMGKNKLWLRNNASNIISQFIDTTVFMVLAFWAIEKGFESNVTFLTSLILPYWLLKSFMSVIETPLVYIGVKWLKDEKKVIVN